MLIITGSIAYDYIMDFPGSFSDHILPDQIHKINLSFIVKTFAKRRGGTAGNVSYTLGLLQAPHKLFSTAGRDFNEYKTALVKLGIDVSSVKVYDQTYTATGFGMTDKVDNQIWGFFYGANDYVDQLKLKTIAAKNDFVLIGPQGAAGSLSFVKQCVALKIPYMFDPGFILTQVNDDELTHGVKHAKFIVGNDYEISLIKKRVKDFNEIIKNKIVITTLGEKGALIEEKGKKITVKPAKAKKVIDPSGAGDAWRAGFLSGFNKNFDLQTCGQMGAIAAVYAVENYGTQEHVFTKQGFTKRYKETYNQNLKI
jgi:adenosine kinase